MIYGYARVSTKGQAKDCNSIEAQEKMLKENGAIEIFTDSFTGTKMDRPQLDLLLSKFARRRHLNCYEIGSNRPELNTR